MPAGRPKKTINYEQVQKLAEHYCTKEDISELMNISVRTAERDPEFCRVYSLGLAKCRTDTRQALFETAIKEHNPKLLEFLARSMLHMRPNGETNAETLNKVEGTLSLLESAILNEDTRVDNGTIIDNDPPTINTPSVINTPEEIK